MLEVVERWYNKIPPIHRDLPLIFYKGKYWTPKEILNEVRKGTRLGEELQRMIEARKFTDAKTLKEIAKKRLLEIIKGLPESYGVASFSGKVYTKEDLIKLVEEEKDFGKILIERELEIVKEELYA